MGQGKSQGAHGCARSEGEPSTGNFHERYCTVFEHALCGVLVIRNDSIILEVNQAMAEMLGRARQELLGKLVTDLIPVGTDAQLEVIRAALETEGVWQGVFPLLLPHGRQVPLHWQVSTAAGDRPYVAVAVRTGRQSECFYERGSDPQARIAVLEQQVAQQSALAEQRDVQLRALAAELSRVEQQERQRLAEILHDHLQQLLVGAKMQSALLAEDLTAEPQQATAQLMDKLLGDAIEVTRSLAVELSPSMLHDRGLGVALDWLAGELEQQHGIRIRVVSDSEAEPEDSEIRDLLFQAARELLLNVVKHAQAKGALVQLRRHQEYFQLRVIDYGRGFDTAIARDRQGFGVHHLRERLERLGGTLQIDSTPGEGTQAVVLIPVEQHARS